MSAVDIPLPPSQGGIHVIAVGQRALSVYRETASACGRHIALGSGVAVKNYGIRKIRCAGRGFQKKFTSLYSKLYNHYWFSIIIKNSLQAGRGFRRFLLFLSGSRMKQITRTTRMHFGALFLFICPSSRGALWASCIAARRMVLAMLGRVIA